MFSDNGSSLGKGKDLGSKGTSGEGGDGRKWLLHVQIRMCRVWKGNRAVEI